MPPPSAVQFPGAGSYVCIDPDINSTRVQSWNGTVARQLGSAWGGSASYLGTHLDRMWGQDALNPGIFMGTGPCTLRGVNYPVCSVVSNTDARRVFSQTSAEAAQKLSYVSQYRDIGTQDYSGLKLSFQNRGFRGITMSGNYTVSKCTTDTPVTGSFLQVNNTWLKPGDPSYDEGNCPYNQTHIGNLTVSGLTPEFGNTVVRAIASDWRVSGILNANSGNWLTVTTTRDLAFNGIPNQRVNQVLDDPYMADKTINGFLNPAAFAFPANGTLGDHVPRSIEGPGFWKVDLALARLLPVGGARTVELRVETFNLFNNFNWGDPTTAPGSGIASLDAGTFGRITTQAGDSRIMQFAVKFGF